MKKASITEAKNRFSALIDEVRHGDTVLILDRGRPVARLESAVAGSESDADGRLARLERQKVPRTKNGASLSKVLLEERREGR